MARTRKEPVVVPNIHIEKIAAEGKCIGHLPDERVIFVPFAVPGDVVDVRLGRRRKSYAEGTVDRLVTPSSHRVDPVCDHFGICGGCKWQQVPYAMQIEAKERQVYDQLHRIGRIRIQDERPIIGCDEHLYYRNKLEYTFSSSRWITDEELAVLPEGVDHVEDREGLGFHIPGRFDKVLDINACHLQDDVNNRIRLFVRRYCKEHEGYPFFDLKEQTGLMRTLMIRTSSTGELMVVVVFAYEDRSLREALLDALRSAFPEITSLLYVINDKKNDTIGDLDVLCYAGRDHIWEEMEGLRFKIGAKSFFQTNSRQAYRLYSVVRDLAELSPDDLVYDLYTGTGTIASFVSRSVRHVIGIEYVPEAIEDAKVNAEVNGLTNTEYYAGDMKDILTEDFLNIHGAPDVIITDPPRAGMHEDVLQVILLAAPERIVYVSCNPASQARDMQVLSAMYDVAVCQPVDMFPQTHHVENVLLLLRKSPDEIAKATLTDTGDGEEIEE